jgi:hypothetical protein
MAQRRTTTIRTMGRTTATPQEVAELSRLWDEYQRAMVFALEIIRTNGPNAIAFPKVRTQHEKACRAIELIADIYGLPKVRRMVPRGDQ